MQAALQISSHLTLTITLCMGIACMLNLQIRKLGPGKQFTMSCSDGEFRVGLWTCTWFQRFSWDANLSVVWEAWQAAGLLMVVDWRSYIYLTRILLAVVVGVFQDSHWPRRVLGTILRVSEVELRISGTILPSLQSPNQNKSFPYKGSVLSDCLIETWICLKVWPGSLTST